MTQKDMIPTPIFDTLENLCIQYKQCLSGSPEAILVPWLESCLGTKTLPAHAQREYYYAMLFLYSYRGSLDTYNSYRRELERFIQWSWFVHKKPLLDLLIREQNR